MCDFAFRRAIENKDPVVFLPSSVTQMGGGEAPPPSLEGTVEPQKRFSPPVPNIHMAIYLVPVPKGLELH